MQNMAKEFFVKNVTRGDNGMRMEIANFLNQQKTDLLLNNKYDAKVFKALAETFGFKKVPLEIWQEVLKNFKQVLAERMLR